MKKRVCLFSIRFYSAAPIMINCGRVVEDLPAEDLDTSEPRLSYFKYPPPKTVFCLLRFLCSPNLEKTKICFAYSVCMSVIVFEIFKF
jgi:hypothetical protein